MDGDRSVENCARWGRSLHSPRQPSRKRNLRALPGRRQQQKKAQDCRLCARESRKTAIKRRGSGPVMHGEHAHEQSEITGAVYAEHTEPTFHRSWPELKKTDQQDRSDPHHFPSSSQQVKRAGSEGEEGPE